MNGGDGWVNDKAVPLLSGAPPQVRERDHDDSHAADIDFRGKQAGLMSQMGQSVHERRCGKSGYVSYAAESGSRA
jgi:hypothetical protein